MIRTGNPTFRGFEDARRWEDDALARAASMTVSGTAARTGVLVSLCAGTAVLAWNPMVAWANAGEFGPLLGATFGSVLLGLVLFLVMMFAKKTSPVLAPLYAITEGAYLTGVSIFVAARYLGPDGATGAVVSAEATGLIFQAVLMTFGVLAGLLVAYGAGLVRIGGTAAKVMCALLGAVLLYWVVLMIGNMAFGAGIPNLFTSASPMGIGFSVLLVVLASFFLILDFQYIEAGAANRLPKYMEWYAGVGLLVTLVWLYVEILRLLAKLRSD